MTERMRMNRKQSTIMVRVPATSANLGPGFDAVGAALKLYNTLCVTRRDPAAGTPCIAITGEGAALLPTDERNVVWQAMQKTFAAVPGHAADAQFGAYALRLTNGIPLASGLGSSAAARLCGMLAANAIMGNKLSEEQLLALGTELEGHPDNMVPALLGGFCVAAATANGLQYVRLKPLRLKVVVAHPAFELPTTKARKVLPKQVPFSDAVFTAGRVGLLVAAAHTGRYAVLREAMDDRIHQPYRAPLIPGFHQVVAAAIAAGACGAALSGAGPSVIAFSAAARAAAVGRAMCAAWKRHAVASRNFILDFDGAGARVWTAGRYRTR
jgi:homoserine kinase